MQFLQTQAEVNLAHFLQITYSLLKLLIKRKSN